MSEKTLSIVVPSYNMEAYLPKCLGSLIIEDKELLQKLEVVVVNDGSKDRTSEIAHGFEAKYPGVFKVIDKPNGHYGSCINAALSVAQGAFVKVLDADDYVDTEAFAQMMVAVSEEAGNAKSEVDLIISDFVDITPKGVVTKQTRYWKEPTVAAFDGIPAPKDRILIHAVCYRTGLLRRIGYRQSEGMPYTDTEWIVEPMAHVRKLRYLPLTVTHYLVGREGQTMDPKVLAGNFQCILRITEGLVSRYGRNYAQGEAHANGYYRQQVINMVELCYSWGLLGYEGVRMEGDIVGFDRHMAEYPEFYRLSGGFRCARFRYVEAWRRHGKTWSWKLLAALNRAYRWIAGLGARG